MDGGVLEMRLDPPHIGYVDEVEVGRPVAGLDPAP